MSGRDGVLVVILLVVGPGFGSGCADIPPAPYRSLLNSCSIPIDDTHLDRLAGVLIDDRGARREDVRIYLNHLASLPDAILNFVKAAQIRISMVDGSVTDFEELRFLADQRADYPGEAPYTYREVFGTAANGQVYLGRNVSGASAMAIHELMHEADGRLGLTVADTVVYANYERDRAHPSSFDRGQDHRFGSPGEYLAMAVE